MRLYKLSTVWALIGAIGLTDTQSRMLHQGTDAGTLPSMRNAIGALDR